MLIRLQSTCHFIVNDYVIKWHVSLGGANYMPTMFEGEQTEKIQFMFFIQNIRSFDYVESAFAYQR